MGGVARHASKRFLIQSCRSCRLAANQDQISHYRLLFNPIEKGSESFFVGGSVQITSLLSPGLFLGIYFKHFISQQNLVQDYSFCPSSILSPFFFFRGLCYMPLLSVTSCVKPFLFLGDSVSNLSFCHIICSMLFPLVGDSVQCVPFCHIICFKPFIFVADSFSSLFFLSHHMFQPPSFCSSFSFNQFLYIKELRFFYLFIYFSVNALR